MFTLADSLHPALPQRLTGATHVVEITNQVLERTFEVLRQVQPVPGIDIQLEAPGCQAILHYVRVHSHIFFVIDN